MRYAFGEVVYLALKSSFSKKYYIKITIAVSKPM